LLKPMTLASQWICAPRGEQAVGSRLLRETNRVDIELFLRYAVRLPESCGVFFSFFAPRALLGPDPDGLGRRAGSRRDQKRENEVKTDRVI